MNKSEFVDELASKTGLTKKDAAIALDASLEIIEEALVGKDEVSIMGFGCFKTKVTKERNAKIPGTDKVVKVPAKRGVKFVVGKTLKDNVEKVGI